MNDMEKVKSSSGPQKKSKPTNASKPKGKATAPELSTLSQQYVAESEDEDAPPEDRSVKKITLPTPQRRSKSKAKADSEQAPPEPKVSSDTSESSEDDSSGDVKQKQGNAEPKVNGVKRKAEDASSSEESEDELPDAPEAKRATTQSSSGEEDRSKEEGAGPKVTSKAPSPLPEGSKPPLKKVVILPHRPIEQLSHL